MTVSDDMVRGYLAGRKSRSMTLPDAYAGESPAFKHGWLNGRDDDTQSPRECADVLRRRASMMEPSA